MTTKNSPLSALRRQAEEIAKLIKMAERGDMPPAGGNTSADLYAKVRLARAQNIGIKVGVVMDDKVFTIELPWATIQTTSEVGLAEYVLKLMRESRDATH